MKTLVVSIAMLFLLTGCPSKKPVDEATAIRRGLKIMDATCIASNFGLTQLAKKDKATADKVAAQVVKYTSEVVLPYLNSQEGVSTLAVNQALQQKFFDQFPDDIKEILALSAAVLDSYLPAPSPDVLLTKEYAVYLQSFFQGLSNGCTKYLGGDLSKDTASGLKAGKPRTWFLPPPKK